MIADDVRLGRLARAFDRAWDWFLLAGLLTPKNLQSARETLAKCVLAADAAGHGDDRRLARAAFNDLWRREVGGCPSVPRAYARAVSRPR